MKDVTEIVNRRIRDRLGLLQKIVLLECDSIRQLHWQRLPTLGDHCGQTGIADQYQTLNRVLRPTLARQHLDLGIL